jgi:acetyl esterase/lipase
MTAKFLHFFKGNMMLSLFAILVLVSCQKETDNGPGTIPEQSYLNVSYGTDAQQKMDIYLPSGRNTTNTKVIILIHGGAWNQGDKSEFTAYVDTLKQRLPDYAIFNINYRLATGAINFFPTQENDIKSAVEFIYSKRSEYLVSDKFVMLGASAGGHLALLQSYKNILPVRIKAVVDFFGPADLMEMYTNPHSPLVTVLLENIIGGTPATHAAMYNESSPLNYVTAQSPPTIILHGGADIVVPSSQSILLKDELLAAGVMHQYVFYPTENHGWFGANLTDSFNKIEAFLDAHVN